MKRIDNIMSLLGLVLLLAIGGLTGQGIHAQMRKMVIPFSGTFPLRIIRDIIAILISLAIRLEWSM